MKKMLLLNGSFNEVQLIHAAHRLGYYVITSGNDSTGEGHKYANEYCPCDYSDKEAVCELAKQKNIDVICACSNDFGALSAAYTCEKLGIAGHDKYETSRFFHEKDCFKKMAEELALPTPAAAQFSSLNDAFAYIESLSSFPLIVKPADLSGGKGISKVFSKEEATEAIADAFNRSKIKRVLIEEYIEGKQQGITVFVQNKKVVLEYATNDDSYINPYMVWLAYPPADNFQKIRKTIVADIEKMAEAKNIADGFLTIQYIVKDDKPYYIETMRRALGNQHYLCMSKDTGVDFFELYIKSQCGEDCSELLKQAHGFESYSGFMAIFAPSNGKIKSIEIDQTFQSKLFDVKMLNGPGYCVTDYLTDKIGTLYFTLRKEDMDWFNKNKRNLFRVMMA
jgi:phosphoribosylamine-glycine ligase